MPCRDHIPRFSGALAIRPSAILASPVKPKETEPRLASPLPPHPGGAARARLLALLLGIVTLSACLLLLELGIRLDDARRGAAPPPVSASIRILRENPAGTGSYRLRPGLDLETQVESLRVRIRTNAHGMHWRETPLQGDGRPRVAFLGDSFTFGSWAADVSQSFVGTFEEVVGPKRVEALNFGVGGYGQLDEELLLQELALEFKPDYVIVALYNGNDFRDTWLGLDKERIEDGSAYLRDDITRQRVPEENLVEDPARAEDCEAPLWRRTLQNSAAFRRAAPLLDLEDLCVRFRPNRNFLVPGFWSRVPPPPVAVQAAREVAEALARMNARVAANGGRLAVVAIPTTDQVYAEEPTGPRFDIGLPQRSVEEFCNARRIPYLDLLPPLRAQAAASNRRLYYARDIHFNAFGHRRAGELIAEWFKARVARPALD